MKFQMSFLYSTFCFITNLDLCNCYVDNGTVFSENASHVKGRLKNWL